MPVLDESRLRQQLAEGELLSLYLLVGEEKYLLKRAARRLIKKAGGDSFPEFNCQELEGSASVEAIADAAEALPFFAEHKCVAVADLDFEERDAVEQGKLFELLENLPETTTLIFWYPTLDPPAKSKWQKFRKKCEEKGGVAVFEKRTPAELQKLLLQRAEKAGAVLSRANAAKIVEYAGQDATRLLNELEKLCAYALGSGAGEITAESIEELVPKTTETTVFLMAGALTAGNYEKAYSLLDSLFYRNEEPIAILGALASAYVDMYRVKAALASGGQASAAREYGDYKGKEFRLRNGERNARSVRPAALRKSLSLLMEADMALKGSRLDGRTVLEELVAKLLLASREERT